MQLPASSRRDLPHLQFDVISNSTIVQLQPQPPGPREDYESPRICLPYMADIDIAGALAWILHPILRSGLLKRTFSCPWHLVSKIPGNVSTRISEIAQKVRCYFWPLAQSAWQRKWIWRREGAREVACGRETNNVEEEADEESSSGEEISHSNSGLHSTYSSNEEKRSYIFMNFEVLRASQHKVTPNYEDRRLECIWPTCPDWALLHVLKKTDHYNVAALISSAWHPLVIRLHKLCGSFFWCLLLLTLDTWFTIEWERWVILSNSRSIWVGTLEFSDSLLVIKQQRSKA